MGGRRGRKHNLIGRVAARECLICHVSRCLCPDGDCVTDLLQRLLGRLVEDAADQPVAVGGDDGYLDGPPGRDLHDLGEAGVVDAGGRSAGGGVEGALAEGGSGELDDWAGGHVAGLIVW